MALWRYPIDIRVMPILTTDATEEKEAIQLFIVLNQFPYMR